MVSGVGLWNQSGGFMLNWHNFILVGKATINGDLNCFNVMIFRILMGMKVDACCMINVDSDGFGRFGFGILMAIKFHHQRFILTF